MGPSVDGKRGIAAMRLTAVLLIASGGGTLMAAAAAEAETLAFESRTIAEDVTHWWARALGDVNDNGLLDIILQYDNAHGGRLGWLETSDDAASWARHTIAEESPDGLRRTPHRSSASSLSYPPSKRFRRERAVRGLSRYLWLTLHLNATFVAAAKQRLLYASNGVNAFAQELVYSLLTTTEGCQAVADFRKKTRADIA
ncbi:MAG: hypothetical protein R6W89_01450, partial [Candidatus Hydrogenedentota bacterium]